MLPTLPDQLGWFVQDRFGLFIHWGLYALAAYNEWAQSLEQLDSAAYRKYFEHFEPDLYNPVEWAQAARAAGMKYVVLTAKHHEGFCLWDSRFTEFKVTNTPYGRDLLAPFVKAFREAGLKIGFYYSLVDWQHPDFPIDKYHPLRDAPNALELNQKRDITRYAQYIRNQVEELLTNYGKIDLLWCDFSYPQDDYKGMPGKGQADWQSEELVQLVRRLQPEILLNNRLDLPNAGDFFTPEQYQPAKWPEINGQKVAWEVCHTLGSSWGYSRDDQGWKSPEQLISLLINSVACGGNLLVNVGPTPRGLLDRPSLAALEIYGEWLRLHGRAIYGCTQSEFSPPPDCRYTQNGKRLYLHILAWPLRELHLPELAGRVNYAQLLNDGSEIKLRLPYRPQTVGDNLLAPDALPLELPIRKPPVTIPVIELFLNE